MLDLFFCSASKSKHRHKMANRCMKRWGQEKVRHIAIDPDGLHCSLRDFQSLRRIHADHGAAGEIYIVADDDCLLLDDVQVEAAVEVMERNPAFAILSLWPSNATIMPWTPGDGYEPIINEDVLEHVSVGGVRFCRKGILADWPKQGGPGYDAEHCAAIRQAGYRVGYFRKFGMEHLGEGETTVWLQ